MREVHNMDERGEKLDSRILQYTKDPGSLQSLSAAVNACMQNVALERAGTVRTVDETGTIEMPSAHLETRDEIVLSDGLDDEEELMLNAEVGSLVKEESDE